MRFYFFGLILSLFFTGCGPQPDAPLAPKLSEYATAQKQCSEFIYGKKELNSAVEKECDKFIKRLDRANTMAYNLKNKEFKKGEEVEKEKVYARERLRVKNRFNSLSKAVKKATLLAIEHDDVDHFIQGISFPGNTFIAPYYDYMKSKGSQFTKDPRYIDFEEQESKRLMEKGTQYLQNGNTVQARELFEAAAEMGNPAAARETGTLYEESDIKQALYWHHKAVDGDIKDSYLNLGHLYEREGQNESALNWYLRSAAEENAKAQYQLYLYFLDKNRSRAVSWLEKSANNQYPLAQYTYAKILIKGTKRDQAIELLKQASRNNYTPASDYLGTYFYDLKLYKSAYTQLSKSESADSFYLRAKMLEEGTGMERDYKLAWTFYTQAAYLGKKGANNDVERVDRLMIEEKRRLAEEEKKKQSAKMAKLVKECGKIPTRSSMKKRGSKLHITGRASMPVGRRSFIIYGDDGEDYYLLQAKGIQEDDYVDISVVSTGSTASVSTGDDENTANIYQFRFLKKCELEEDAQ